MSFTPFNGPLLSGLIGDMQIAQQFSIKADLAAMLRFEIALAKTQTEFDVIPKAAEKAIADLGKSFEPDMEALRTGVIQDGMAVPDFVRQLKAAISEPHAQYVHFGSTSQDVIDTSAILRLVEVNAIFEARLNKLEIHLQSLAEKFGAQGLMAQTRMQQALPIKVRDRLASWSRTIHKYQSQFADIQTSLNIVQFAGPVGTLDKFGDIGPDIRKALAKELGLGDPGYAWHTDRSTLCEYVHWMNAVGSALGKVGQDIVLMAQNERDEIRLANTGGSSAMAHKKNPVRAEILITLAHFISVQCAGFQGNLIHEQERSGAAWTLEWMLLPQICVATGAALNNAITLVQSIESIGSETAI
ncbi:MAG: 3-carboxy-cis,cis-muconate cycloisomerase [Pseudomonadota bacterium]